MTASRGMGWFTPRLLERLVIASTRKSTFGLARYQPFGRSLAQLSPPPRPYSTNNQGPTPNSSFGSSPSPIQQAIHPPANSAKSYKSRYVPALTSLSQRTGVPLPSLLISFAFLHELTAILPLVLVFYIFSALGAGAGLVSWITATGSIGQRSTSTKGTTGRAEGQEGEGRVEGWRRYVVDWYEEGSKRVERVGRRYGILGYEKVSTKSTKADTDTTTETETATSLSSPKPSEDVGDITLSSVNGSKAAEKVADAIAAYVVVKALLPVRIGLSIAAAPAFARWTLMPAQRLVGRWSGRGRGV